MRVLVVLRQMERLVPSPPRAAASSRGISFPDLPAVQLGTHSRSEDSREKDSEQDFEGANHNHDGEGDGVVACGADGVLDAAGSAVKVMV